MNGSVPEALEALRERLRRQGGSVELWSALARRLIEAGEPAQACDAWRQASDCAPRDPAPLCGLAGALEAQGETEQALRLWRRAVALAPQDLEGLIGLGRCLRRLGQGEEALAQAHRALALGAQDCRAPALLGVLLAERGALQAAEPWLRQALELAPRDPDRLSDLAALLEGLDRAEQAVPLLRQALALNPDLVRARLNLAVCLRRCGDAPGARRCLEEGLRRATPADPQLGWLLGQIQLLQGDYRAGWRGFELRFTRTPPSSLVVEPGEGRWWPPACGAITPEGGSCGAAEPLPLPPPVPLLRLIGEQGLGDMIQFARYVPLLGHHARQLELVVAEPLVALLAGVGLADAVIGPERFQRECQGQAAVPWLPLLSLPALLGVTPGRILVDSPYLPQDPVRLAHWRSRLAAGESQGPGGRPLLIGLNWQGNPASEQRGHLRGRSLPLEALAPVASLEGVRFVALQKGFGADQWRHCSFADRFVACQQELEACLDFRDAAAVIGCCDLVLSSDTVVPHLAGALGAPVWLLLPLSPDWRWGLSGERSHWYPTMRLFRQRRSGDWAEPIERVRQALLQLLAEPSAHC